VMDQVIYKWAHSREVIASVLGDQYEKLAATGWAVSETQIERDVKQLFGGAFEKFIG